MEPAHLLGTGGALGAVIRYTDSQLLVHDQFPSSTLFVNVVGSFVLGFVVFAGFNNEIALFVGTGGVWFLHDVLLVFGANRPIVGDGRPATREHLRARDA